MSRWRAFFHRNMGAAARSTARCSYGMFFFQCSSGINRLTLYSLSKQGHIPEDPIRKRAQGVLLFICHSHRWTSAAEAATAAKLNLRKNSTWAKFGGWGVASSRLLCWLATAAVGMLASGVCKWVCMCVCERVPSSHKSGANGTTT